ncbi:MAG: Endonuclease/Exonuclease/phosphatase family protein [Acidobacteria bacterium]|nr:Endonuclease/Exonuclease/phosphatase family protein [Acidobacteriota bacterium]
MRLTYAAVVLLVVALSSCARHQPPAFDPPNLADLSCRQVVPPTVEPLAWIATADVAGERELSRWCETVGAVFLQPRPMVVADEPIDRLAIVSWNIHESGGDVDELLRQLRSGAFTGAVPVRHFVLLLQEATRSDDSIPLHVARGYPSPSAIAPRGASPPAEVHRIAREGLAVLYAPSMRNGPGREDRGNVIVSTLPLREPRVIELPLERQRRVAAVATVAGRTSRGSAWRLDLADVHLDTALALGHGGPFAARRRQATALLDALRPSIAAAGDGRAFVLAGDLNTWMGDGEAAVGVLSAAFPDTPPANRSPTWRGPLGLHATLDHVFVRGTVSASAVTRLPSRLGSDHFPLLTVLRF